MTDAYYLSDTASQEITGRHQEGRLEKILKKCSHYVPLEERCRQCVAEGLAREAVHQANSSKNDPQSKERFTWADRSSDSSPLSGVFVGPTI
jgi:hypothetical protein